MVNYKDSRRCLTERWRPKKNYSGSSTIPCRIWLRGRGVTYMTVSKDIDRQDEKSMWSMEGLSGKRCRSSGVHDYKKESIRPL